MANRTIPHKGGYKSHSWADRNELRAWLSQHCRVDGERCWNWTKAKNELGYGVFTIDKRQRHVHRVSAVLYLGLDIDSPLKALHHCDNPSCFNPAHLYIGTDADNMRDKVRRRRCNAPHSENAPGRKLTREQVIQVFVLLAQGMSQSAIARRFGISQTGVSSIKRGASWKYAQDLRSRFAP